MRSEEEMLKLILDTAREDERIRAVVMNGSKVNLNAPKDFFQDYDVVYFVTDILPFKNNYEWIKRFGELMVMQEPDDMDEPAPGAGGFFTYLMQFKDGNRIDLGFYPLERVNEVCEDSLTIILLDKDGRLPALPAPNESGYLPKEPTRKAYDDCCNEFWWVCPYVAKGLWRREIIYARYMLDEVVRVQLMKMLRWYIGVQTGFSLNPGKYGKYYEKYLEPEMWEMLLGTYATGEYEPTWEALLLMGTLFRKAAVEVGRHFGYNYPREYDDNVSSHLRHVRKLPREAKEMY